MTPEAGAAAYPATPPHLACRYTALEVVALALRWVPGATLADHAAFQTVAQEAALPDALRTRLAGVLADGTPDALTFHPYLTHEQQVALLLTLHGLNVPETAPIVEGFARSFRIAPDVLQFVLERAPRVDPMVRGSLSEALLTPADEMLEFARALAFRLRIGAAKARTVGHIPPSLYEHEADGAALRALREVTGFDAIARKVSEWAIDRAYRIESTSSKIRVTSKQFPELHTIWRETLERAGMVPGPALYVDASGMNAFTRGVHEKQVVLGSSLVALLDPVELMFVLGHELGHIRSEHVLYRMVAEALPDIIAILGQATLGLGTLAAWPLRLALLDWYRKSELTCDRFGLLVCQDLNAAGRTLMKVSGAPLSHYRVLDWREFAAQASGVNINEKIGDKFLAIAMAASQSHPWPAVRAAELQCWAEHGPYKRLRDIDARELHAAIENSHRQLSPAPVVAPVPKCRSCGHALEAGHLFCDACGTKR